MRIVADERGQALVFVVLGMGALLAIIALVMDVGQLLYTKRQLQTAADAAAIAAALEIQQCGSTPNCAVMQAAAKSAFTENGMSTPTLVTQCATGSGNGLILQLNNGPCALGASDPNYQNKSVVEVSLSKKQPTMFGKLLGISTVNLTVRAESGSGGPSNCVYVMNPTASQALLMNSNSQLTAQCGVMVNSNSGSALLANSGVKLTATTINIVGGKLVNGSPTISPTPTLGASAVPDPLASTPKPTDGPCGSSTASPFWGSANNVSVSGNITFNPGVYCGGINLNSGATATLNAGTYIFKGSLNAGSSSSITGNGVTLYFSSGSLTMNSSSHASFVAPTSGTYSGILLYQDSSDSSSIILNGDTTSKWQGAVYAPSAQLTLNGGSNLAAYTIIDVNTIIVNTTTFTIGSDYSSLSGGAPIKGSGASLAE
jgi:Flp pilus assembly protein TadG